MPVFVAWQVVYVVYKPHAWFVKCFAGFHGQALALAPAQTPCESESSRETRAVMQRTGQGRES